MDKLKTSNNLSAQKKISVKQKIAIGAVAGVLAIGLSGGAIYLINHQEEATNIVVSDQSSESGSTKLMDGKNKIESGGTYTFTGSTENGKIVVDTTEEVRIILENVTITNSDGAAIKCKEGSNVTIELIGENKLSSTDAGDSQNDPANVISSDGELVILGDGSVTLTGNGKGIKAETKLVLQSGSYNINTTDDAIHSNADILIEGGAYAIKTSNDGIHADGLLEINGGSISITAVEGLEGTNIKINDGTIDISASDDGINAAAKSTNYTVAIEINGGNVTIKMGQGDTDAIDSNGDIYINGGVINITGQSPFDYDGTAKYNGGTLIINGTETTEITNQFMGGGMMMNGSMPGQQVQQSEQQNQAQQTQAPNASTRARMIMR